MPSNIHTPSQVHVDEQDDTKATISIEPLHSGYGMTLGNSLRRVLLSSIAGAGITSFRVEGASHEFTTLPGVKEDVVDIILNLKSVRFRVFGDEPQTVRLTKKGKGIIKAKDIASTSEVEVVNPDQVIAALDDSSASVSMDLVIEKGRGYKPVAEDTGDKSIADFISIDTVFSPVLRVRYRVENTRVGQMTDLDKLIIDIETDGSISAKDAFEEAAAILINQYTALAGQTRIKQELVEEEEAEGQTVGGDDGDSPMLMTPIEEFNFTARTTNALINNEIHTLKDLFSLSDVELKELKGFGSKALEEVKEKMTEMEF